jgi:hypothetical protein
VGGPQTERCDVPLGRGNGIRAAGAPPLWTRVESDRPGSPHVAGVRDADPDAALAPSRDRTIDTWHDDKCAFRQTKCTSTTTTPTDEREWRARPHAIQRSRHAPRRARWLHGSMARLRALRIAPPHAMPHAASGPAILLTLHAAPSAPRNVSPRISPPPPQESHMSRLDESHMSRLDHLTCRDWTRPP